MAWGTGIGLAAALACAPVENASTPPASAADAQRSTPPAVDLPLRQLRTGHIVLPVTLADGVARDFILDTGASISVITPPTRDALGLSPDTGTLVQGKGAGGSTADVRIVQLTSLRVADRDYAALDAAVMDLAHLDGKLGASVAGILGRNFLEQHVVELDFAHRLLRLHGAEARAPEAGLREVPFERFEAGGLIRVAVSLGKGPPFPAVLDLGAGRSVINWQAGATVGVEPGSEGLAPAREPLLGADNEPIESASRTFDDLFLGTVAFPSQELFLADLPVFAVLGIDAGPAMVFGVDLFRGRRLVLDYRHNRLLVSERAAS